MEMLNNFDMMMAYEMMGGNFLRMMRGLGRRFFNMLMDSDEEDDYFYMGRREVLRINKNYDFLKYYRKGIAIFSFFFLVMRNGIEKVFVEVNCVNYFFKIIFFLTN